MAKMGDPGTSPCTCLNAIRTSSSLPTYRKGSTASCTTVASAGSKGRGKAAGDSSVNNTCCGGTAAHRGVALHDGLDAA